MLTVSVSFSLSLTHTHPLCLFLSLLCIFLSFFLVHSPLVICQLQLNAALIVSYSLKSPFSAHNDSHFSNLITNTAKKSSKQTIVIILCCSSICLYKCYGVFCVISCPSAVQLDISMSSWPSMSIVIIQQEKQSDDKMCSSADDK